MGPTTLNLGSVYARLVWPIILVWQATNLVFNNPTPLFEHVNISLEKTWGTLWLCSWVHIASNLISRLHAQLYCLMHDLGSSSMGRDGKHFHVLTRASFHHGHPAPSILPSQALGMFPWEGVRMCANVHFLIISLFHPHNSVHHVLI